MNPEFSLLAYRDRVSDEESRESQVMVINMRHWAVARGYLEANHECHQQTASDSLIRD